MTEEELRAIFKGCRERYPDLDCREINAWFEGIEKGKEAGTAIIAKLEAELEQVKRERDAAVETWRGFCAKCEWVKRQFLSDGRMDDRCKTCRENNKCNWQWRGVKEAKPHDD